MDRLKKERRIINDIRMMMSDLVYNYGYSLNVIDCFYNTAKRELKQEIKKLYEKVR